MTFKPKGELSLWSTISIARFKAVHKKLSYKQAILKAQYNELLL